MPLFPKFLLEALAWLIQIVPLKPWKIYQKPLKGKKIKKHHCFFCIALRRKKPWHMLYIYIYIYIYIYCMYITYIFACIYMCKYIYIYILYILLIYIVYIHTYSSARCSRRNCYFFFCTECYSISLKCVLELFFLFLVLICFKVHLSFWFWV